MMDSQDYVQKNCGPGGSKRQGAGLRAGRPGFDPGCRRGGDFSSLFRVQTGPEVHSDSYKMSTGGKGGRALD